MPAVVESNGIMACQSPTTHAKKRLGTVSGERFATLGDLELALQAAIHVNQHLNREIEAVLNRLHKAEQERTAWQQRAQLLAKQLAKERRLHSPAGEAWQFRHYRYFHDRLIYSRAALREVFAMKGASDVNQGC